MSRLAVALMPLILASCVNFRVPLDDVDVHVDGWSEGLRDGAPDDADAEQRPYPDTLGGYDPSWCSYSDQLVTATTSSLWLDAASFEPLADEFMSVDVVCATPGVGPEQVFRLEAPAGTGLRARFEADWAAVLTVTRGGCRVAHVTACQATDLADTFDAGRIYLFLEAAVADQRTGAYRLAVALNHVTGYATCPVQREVRASAFAAAPVLSAPDGRRYREVQVTDDTSLAADRFYLPCAGDGVTPDAFGGAPDHVIALVADFVDGRTRRADVTLDTGGAWDGVLTVTGAPCGASGEVLGCAGPGQSAPAVRDLLWLPNVPLYVVIDGRGDDMTVGRAAGPYGLNVRIYEP